MMHHCPQLYNKTELESTAILVTYHKAESTIILQLLQWTLGGEQKDEDQWAAVELILLLEWEMARVIQQKGRHLVKSWSISLLVDAGEDIPSIVTFSSFMRQYCLSHVLPFTIS